MSDSVQFSTLLYEEENRYLAKASLALDARRQIHKSNNFNYS